MSWISMKLAAYMAPYLVKPPQNAARAERAQRKLQPIVVSAVATPPPAALASMLRYRPACRVMGIRLVALRSATAAASR